MLKLEDALGCFHRWRGHLDKLWKGRKSEVLRDRTAEPRMPARPGLRVGAENARLCPHPQQEF